MNKSVILMMILMCSIGSFSMSQPLDVLEPVTQNRGVTSSATSTKDAAVIHVQVNGMVCSFCAQGIKKTFEKHGAVSDVVVDLDTLVVTLRLVPGMSISDDAIRQVIEDAGYSIEGIDR